MRHFLLGLGVGLAGGILLAPKPGFETREYLGQKTDEGLDYVKTRATELSCAASDLVAQGKTAASGFVDKTKATAADLVDKGKSTAADLMDKGKQAMAAKQPDVEAMESRLRS